RSGARRKGRRPGRGALRIGREGLRLPDEGSARVPVPCAPGPFSVPALATLGARPTDGGARMSGELVIVLVLLVAAIAMFAVGRPRMDVVAVLMIVLLPLSGILTV